MKNALKQHSVKHGRRQESFVPLIMIWVKSPKPELPNKSRKMHPKHFTNSSKSPLQVKRQIGPRGIKGIESGRHIQRQNRIFKSVQNYYRLLNVVPFNGSLGGPVFILQQFAVVGRSKRQRYTVHTHTTRCTKIFLSIRSSRD